MKKQYLVILLLFALAKESKAQSWQWGRRGGGSSGSNNQAEKIVDMQTDKNGNVYMLAQLDGGGDATVSTQGNDSSLLFNGGTRDGALISYDCNGKFRWAKILGSSTYDDAAIGMTMDTLGHIYVAMSTSIDFNVDTDTSAANPNFKTIGLLQFDTSGHYKWFKMPNPDTANEVKNISQFGIYNIATTPNGDTYLFCYLGTGLIAGTNNLVVNTRGWYMLKYNIAGIPKELIPLSMNIPVNLTSNPALDGDYLNATNFSVTKSRKFIFTGIRVKRNNGTYPITIGGQVLKHPINLVCFSPTGSVLWRIEDTDTTTGGILGRPLVNEANGKIYFCGGANGTVGDTIQGAIVKNSYTFAYPRVVPFVAALDTFGNVVWLTHANTNEAQSSLSGLINNSNSNLFACGDGATVFWNNFKFVNNKFIGYQIFMPSFDRNTGTILSMDSLMGSSSATYGSVIAADNNNNVYVGGLLSYDVKVGTQTLTTMGGQSDFFVAKYGYANCSGAVPLKFINYEIRYTNDRKIENIWTTANEVNVSHFNIQRSTNGKDFATIGKVSANNKSYNEYSFIDGGSAPSPLGEAWGEAFYRIESVDFDGKKEYSRTKQITIKPQTPNIVLFPNPAKNIVTINCVRMKELKIIDELGQIIIHQTINNTTHKLNVSSLNKGVYVLSIFTAKGEIKNEKLIIQ